MHQLNLTGAWQFQQVDSSEWMPATVPGGVHTDLLALGKIPDPFKADFELDVQWVAQKDWVYQRTFDVNAELLSDEQVFLVCDGLDTLADVVINGNNVGHAEDMFIQYRWDVKQWLHAGTNELKIHFASPVNYVTEKNSAKTLLGVSQAIPGGPYLRKAPCQWGWDWGPMLPPIGIWKDIRLEGYSQARIQEVHWKQIHGDNGVTILADVEIATLKKKIACELRLRITTPQGGEIATESVIIAAHGQISVLLQDAQLWWPNGYGEQPLYEANLELLADGNVLDSQSVKLGLRTLEVRRQPDEWGESFTFVVNGVPIFAKGSNWIPAESFPTRLTHKSMNHLIRSAAESHQNMLRVWGGGFYEDNLFYDLCDQYGILVWQDMIFSCSIYPHDDEQFNASVKEEITQNVIRLRHRASLALWCGNNEMEMGWEFWGWMQRASEHQDAYDRFFHKTLPGWIAELDPSRLYWPSSPSSNTPFKNSNGQAVGDAHYWDVWHGRKPFTAYRNQYPRFMSEFGFQSLPPLDTVKTYADKKDWNMTSYIMEHHQRSGSGNGLMIAQMTDTFRMPKDFQSLVYLSMVLQAEGIRYGVEHWRRNKNRVSGTLYWQLNDCWPVASWSSLDYFGRWKALHYAARRFYAPVLLSIEEQGSLMDVHLTSDLNEAWRGAVHWALITLDGILQEAGVEYVNLDPLESRKVFSKVFNLDSKQSRSTVFVASIWQASQQVAASLATFVPNKHLELVDPGLQVQVTQEDGNAVFSLTSRSLARFVELKLEGYDVIFSDNYFDVTPEFKVVVNCPIPEGLDIESIKQKLSITSLYNSF